VDYNPPASLTSDQRRSWEPQISVITPVLNDQGYIENAIRSVLGQDYPRFEHVIIDGGSTDGTLEIVKRYAHLRWISEPDGGLADAMNKGFRLSNGDIVVYLMGDDYFEPGAFSAVLPYFRRGARFVVGCVKLMYEGGPVVLNDPKIEFGDMLRWWEANAYCHNPVGYFYLPEVQKTVGEFDRDIAQDLQFLLRASQHYSFTKINDILGTFRIRPGTKTFQTSAEESEIMRSICDPYLDHLDRTYVQRYVRDRRAAERELGAESGRRARLSVRKAADAVRRKVQAAAKLSRERPQ
jgi:glycosyltransferase involved in cell wall biosynthesis